MNKTFHAQNFREENELRLICFQLDDHYPWISIQRTVFQCFTSWLFVRERFGAQGYLLKSLHGQRFWATSTFRISHLQMIHTFTFFPKWKRWCSIILVETGEGNFTWQWKNQPIEDVFPRKNGEFQPSLPPRTFQTHPEVGYVTTKCPKARFLLDLIDNWDLPRCGTRTMQRWIFFPQEGGGPENPVICRFVLKVLTGINGCKLIWWNFGGVLTIDGKLKIVCWKRRFPSI